MGHPQGQGFGVQAAAQAHRYEGIFAAVSQLASVVLAEAEKSAIICRGEKLCYVVSKHACRCG